MRIFDTKYFIDKNRDQVMAHYDAILTDDLTDPATLRALLELKMYHLPPYFNTSQKAKVMLNNMFRSTDGNTVIEYDLLHANSTIHGSIARETCPRCGRHKQLVTMNKTMCVDCWAHLLHTLYSLWHSQVTWIDAPIRYFNLRETYHESYAVPGYEWFWELEQWKDLVELGNITAMKNEFRFILQAYKRKTDTYESHSPKRTLLAHLMGCTMCGTKLELNTSIWDTTAEGWMDGVCPSCVPHRGIWHNSQYEPVGYNECYHCLNLHLPYAMWGICVECYSHWQDRYLNPDILFSTAKELGTLALLLIRPDHAWVNYVRNNLPTAYSKTNKDPVLTEWKPKLTQKKINIRERVCSIVNEN